MHIYLRDADEHDRDILFHWANEEMVRRHSFSEDEILYEEHCKWFEDMMNDKNRVQWILMMDKEPIGQIRLLFEGENAEISYSICVEKRGQGYGKEILELARQRVNREYPNVKKLIARVKPDNEASIKLFEQSRYKKLYINFMLDLTD